MYLRLAFGSLFALLGGCSLIVSPEDAPIRCASGGVDPCPPGLACTRGICQTRGVVDAGDSAIDASLDGPPFDAIMDVAPPDTITPLDAPPADAPPDSGSPLCPAICPRGQRCNVAFGRCESVVPPPGPTAFGGACSYDSDCASLHCAPFRWLGIDRAGSFCTSACCRDSDCGAEQICWADVEGGKACIQASLVSRERGPELGPATCSDSQECASGICSGTTCVVNCSRNSDCTGGRVCGTRVYNRRYVPGGSAGYEVAHLQCVTPTGMEPIGTICSDDEECASNVCVGGCSAPCASQADCDVPFPGVHCGTEDYSDESGEPLGAPQVCRIGFATGTGTCTSNDQCLEEYCDRFDGETTGFCGATCCSAGPTGPGSCPAGLVCHLVPLEDDGSPPFGSRCIVPDSP